MIPFYSYSTSPSQATCKEILHVASKILLQMILAIHNAIAECQGGFWCCNQSGHQASTEAAREEEEKTTSRVSTVSNPFLHNMSHLLLSSRL